MLYYVELKKMFRKYKLLNCMCLYFKTSDLYVTKNIKNIKFVIKSHKLCIVIILIIVM